MSVLIVPSPEKTAWPSLGPLVCQWMEHNLVRGPGDLLGEPLKLDDEWRWLIRRLYEVYPPDHPHAGRRRFKRACASLRKGSAKTEMLALIVAAELHPRAPVRCRGFDKGGRPVGRGVKDPYIPMIAYTEEQSDELAYSALKQILTRSRVADDFDIGEERIMRIGGDGIAQALSSAPDARDGARTTFNAFDETHRFTRHTRARAAHRTMQANTPKRAASDPWSLEITTAPAPGEGSVAEAAHEHARAIRDGRAVDPSFFYFHREAGPEHDLSTPEGLRAAVIDASGPAAAWSDIDAIVAQWAAPDADPSYLRRVWLNQLVKAGGKAFDVKLWRSRKRPDAKIPDGALVALGFDGSRVDDATGLVATDVETGLQEVLGCWERPAGTLGDGWEVPEGDVEAAVADAFERFQVWRFYADPPYWEGTVAAWIGKYGADRVVRWSTGVLRKMSYAVRAFVNAMVDGSLAHDGSNDLARHIANAHRRPVSVRDDRGGQMWVIQKEREGSPDKIDLAMAAILSWQARLDAIAAGAHVPRPSVYETRGLVTA